MYQDMMNNLLQSNQSFPAHLVKMNQMMVANVEKLTQFQLSSAKSYMDLGLSQLKAASEISDAKGLQDFYGKQMESTKVLRQRMLEDSKTLADMSASFKADFDKLTKEGVEEIGKASKIAPRKAA